VDFFSAANPGRATINVISKKNCCMTARKLLLEGGP
jgi:hypothetical protein